MLSDVIVASVVECGHHDYKCTGPAETKRSASSLQEIKLPSESAGICVCIKSSVCGALSLLSFNAYE